MDVIFHALDQEPFGIVVVEAMALGKPVIADSDGGPREIIEEGVNGLLCPFGDDSAMAKAILRRLDDHQFAQQIGQAARLRFQDFTAARYAIASSKSQPRFCVLRSKSEKFLDIILTSQKTTPIISPCP